MPYKAGDRVRIPKRDGKGMIVATVVTPAEPGRKPRYAWVRIEDGDDAGSYERVPYAQIEYAA